mmetsp:Transcript_45408/g.75387  ORF Transcript_45408/g.75387 Transcript_45408/m.75387 type:complete len:337 (+) Transcript_45408:35-1045(+)|eukprot:CAMPEP_0202734196 /NCGR_PEP_ID=MMETSP1385-20130828/188550_1 /ASSEMBLY_ACC=CAM_ASM_000861 /TAXON_ID=933848 /ORGANISM="Elphidium margaritaceum" /LENGTH=336 /DNA_ID=CAMNT_0049400543 /DNA_START=51 /DNA_END=1061 /DNA_ORIENTATION=+
MSIIGSAIPTQGYGRHRTQKQTENESMARNHAFFFASTKGQHILKNPGIIRDMVEKAGIKETDIVLEVGPGTGNLTMQLLQRCKKVIAIEVDVRMISELRKRVSGTEFASKLDIIHGDAIKIKTLPFFNLCIANIPYQISSPLIFKLLAHRPSFRCAILMVQDEFAKRCVSRVGDYFWSRLSINCQLLARVSYLKKVSKQNFRPPPKVESALLRIEPRMPVPSINFIEWDGLIRICFERRHRLIRKVFSNKNVLQRLHENYGTLNQQSKQQNSNSNSNSHHQQQRQRPNYNLEQTKKIIFDLVQKSGISDKRSRHLDVTDFLRLLKFFNDRGIHFK